jgi:20S proteasome alpha/beta subunit
MTQLPALSKFLKKGITFIIFLSVLAFCRQPIVTGTSVIAIKYADGVMMATDCLGKN